MGGKYEDATFTLDQLAALNQADPNSIRTGRLLHLGADSMLRQ